MLRFKCISNDKSRIEFDDEDRRDFDILRDYFKTENVAARFVKNPRFQMQQYIYAITPTGQYATGMTDEICEQCRKSKIEYEIDEKLEQMIHIPFDFEEILSVPNEKYQYRDYQYQLIDSLAMNGRGVIISPTRSGKSLIIAGLIHNVFQNVRKINVKNVLIIVPNIQLVFQFENDLNEYGLGNLYHIQPFTAKTMSKKGSKVIIDKMNIYIANSQYLMLHGDELPYSDMIFCDECHQCKKGTEIAKIIKSAQISHKFGCTGTLPEGIIDKWNISGIFGPVVDEVEIQKLQKDKILANVKIFPIKFVHSKKENFRVGDIDENGVQETDPMKIAQKAYMKEAMYLDTFEQSNIIVLNMIKKLVLQHQDWNILALFDYTEQGNQLFKLFDYDTKHYVDGSIDVKIREGIVKQMDESGGNVLFAQSKTFSTGITISRLNAIILFNAGKSATKIIQSIGRGLRRQFKTSIVVFDILHNYQYSERHFKDRIELYKQFYRSRVSEKIIQLKQ